MAIRDSDLMAISSERSDAGVLIFSEVICFGNCWEFSGSPCIEALGLSKPAGRRQSKTAHVGRRSSRVEGAPTTDHPHSSAGVTLLLKLLDKWAAVAIFRRKTTASPQLAHSSHRLTVEARDRPAITSLRLLAVLNVLSEYASLIK